MDVWNTIDPYSNSLTNQRLVYELGSQDFNIKTKKGDEMRATKVTVGEGSYEFSFVARPRKTGNSVTPFLVTTADYESSVLDPDRKVSKEVKRRAYALAAVILNKFRK